MTLLGFTIPAILRSIIWQFKNDFEGQSDNEDESDIELNEWRAQIVKNTTITLQSSSNCLELFYQCKVLDFGLPSY